MDPITVPEDLSALGEADIVALADGVRSRIRYLAGQKPYTRATVDEMTALRGELDRVNTRAVELDDERQEIEAAAAAALTGIDGDAPVDAEVVEAAGNAADTVADTVVVDGAGGEADPAEVQAAAEVVAEAEEIVAAAPVTPISQRDALTVLARRQQASDAGRQTIPVATVDTAPEATYGLSAATTISLPRGRSIEAGTTFADDQHFAGVITDLLDRNRGHKFGSRSFEYVGHADLFPADSPQRLIESDEVRNFSILNAATNPAEAAASLNERVSTLVASGTLCPPDNPIYDFFRLAVPQAPVEAALPTVAAPRGGIRYISPVDFRDARAAIGTRTKVENADANTPDKPCSRAVCPSISEAYVTAVSECVRWDNLTYRAFPELVQNYMTDVAVNFASVKECLYLTAIDSASTHVNADLPVYGAMRALAYQLRMAASAYRKRQNMPRNAQLVWYAPNWLPDVLLADMVNDHALGLEFLTRGTEALVAQVISNLNITPVWYNDQANCGTNWVGDTQAWRLAQGATGLNQWPSDVVTYLHSPGTFVRMDSGSLDVGLVRDSTLNGTNDLELFMEQWVGMIMLGIESIRIVHRLCPNGTAPDAVPELDCVGFAS